MKKETFLNGLMVVFTGITIGILLLVLFPNQALGKPVFFSELVGVSAITCGTWILIYALTGKKGFVQSFNILVGIILILLGFVVMGIRTQLKKEVSKAKQTITMKI